MYVKTAESVFIMNQNDDKIQGNGDKIHKKSAETGFKTVQNIYSHNCRKDDNLYLERSQNFQKRNLH